jgi:hypothetical protein
MTTSLAADTARTESHPRLGRSAAAILVALVANAVAATATDQLFHVLDVYPPWGEPMRDAGDFLLALGYRLAYGVLAGYLAARLAPRAPMRHVRVLGSIALVLSSAGVLAALTRPGLGPVWYPVALAVLAIPSVWAGGVLHQRRHAGR